MNNKDFIASLSQQLGKDPQSVAKMINELSSTLAKRLIDGDSIAIPGFGHFESKKKAERITINPVTKKKYLTPPKLTAVFKPSSVLKAKLKDLTNNE
ncbi:MAG: HU family DNA-binding protein [Tannerellaceae bacterium]